MDWLSRIVSGGIVAVFASSVFVSALAQAEKTAPVMPPPRPTGPVFERPMMPPRPPGMSPFGLGEDGYYGQDITKLDPIMLARQYVRPSAEQSAKLQELSSERQKQLTEARREVDRQILAKVKELLTDQQKKQLDGVEAAVEVYQKKMDEAGAALAASGGDRLAMAVTAGPVSTRQDLTQYLELTPQQRTEISQLQMEMVNEMQKGRQALPPLKSMEDREAVTKYQTSMKEITDKAQANLQEKRKAVFTKEQTDKLAKMEEALRVYNEKALEARTELNEAVRKAVTAGMPEATPTPPAGAAPAPLGAPVAAPPAAGKAPEAAPK